MKRKTHSNRPRSGFRNEPTSQRSIRDRCEYLLGNVVTCKTWIARGLLGLVGLTATGMYIWACYVVFRQVRVAMKQTPSKINSAQLKGEEWQKGNQQRGSLIRFGGSLNSDDLRHRLNELRSSKSGGPERRTPKTGGHYAKQ